jgi:hypothetical protein
MAPMPLASRFGDFPRNTLSCWRGVGISASSGALDRNRPMTVQQISLRISAMGASVARFVAICQSDRIHDRDSFRRTNAFDVIQRPSAALTSARRVVKFNLYDILLARIKECS